MPLTAPVPDRDHIHTRRVELQGYSRADGQFDIEARMTDTKTYGFATDSRAWVDPGEPLHGMVMRMTVDDTLTITGFEAAIDYSPYAICPEVAPNFTAMVGLRVGPGFLRAAAERVGGTHGCTHLREMLQPMATVAYQTLYPTLAKRGSEAAARKPPLLNTCHAYRDTGPVVQKKWPAHFAGPAVP